MSTTRRAGSTGSTGSTPSPEPTPVSVPGPARARPGRSRAWPWVLLATTFVVYALTAARSGISMDVWSAHFASWRLATTGDPSIDGVAIPQLDGNPLRDVWVLRGADGHQVIGRSPGVIAASLPLYWLASVTGLSTEMSLVPGALTAAALTALTVTLLFLALRARLSEGTAALAALALGLATPVWSVAANGVWPHTVTVLGIAGMAWAAATGRWWLVGVFGGVTLWGRLHAAVIVAVLGLLVGWRRRDPRLVARVALPGAASLLALCTWTRWMYGSWNPTSSYDTSVFTGYAETNRLSITNQLGFWVSPDRGILVWTPIVLLLLPALVRAWRDLPDWSRALVWGGLVYTVLQAGLNRFSGGDTFYGYRLGLELVASATPALALSVPRLGTWARRLVGPVLAAQSYAISLGATVDSYYVPTDRVWVDNAFVVALRSTFPGGAILLVLAVLAGVLAQWLVTRHLAGRRPTAVGPAPAVPDGTAPAG